MRSIRLRGIFAALLCSACLFPLCVYLYSYSCEFLGIGCPPCAPGTKTSLDGCETCPAGTFAESFGSTECISCPVGTFSKRHALQCFPCSPGRISTDIESAECVPCPPGQGTNGQTGQTTCVDCSPGTYSGPDDDDCLSCPLNSYSADVGAFSCTPCETGLFARWTGSTACEACVDRDAAADVPRATSHSSSAVSSSSSSSSVFDSTLTSSSSRDQDVCAAGSVRMHFSAERISRYSLSWLGLAPLRFAPFAGLGDLPSYPPLDSSQPEHSRRELLRGSQRGMDQPRCVSADHHEEVLSRTLKTVCSYEKCTAAMDAARREHCDLHLDRNRNAPRRLPVPSAFVPPCPHDWQDFRAHFAQHRTGFWEVFSRAHERSQTFEDMQRQANAASFVLNGELRGGMAADRVPIWVQAYKRAEPLYVVVYVVRFGPVLFCCYRAWR